ncbi:MAG: hypothetical protein J0H85_09880 [Sediminibacterium magnilacihabitans]|jgi:hypothetical protein|nr:hypothetical protein [Sediminibacterium magnilacihabitans]PQV60143.1 hypothetical protein CLV53_11073 [Sediminibacterium magnilacihabitans]
MAALSPTQITNISNGVSYASRDSIKDILFDNKSVLSNDEWLNIKNKYIVDTINRIWQDNQPGGKIVSKYLGDYIAISSVLHCKDAWDYFSCAISAVLEGNIYNAIHFAYYAELRATMSFLASEGIGVFNGINYYVDSTGKCKRFTGNIATHKFVWPALNEWSKLVANRNTLLDIVTVHGYSINSWLQGAEMLVGSPLTTTLAAEWLSRWSLDLQVLSDDHSVRNIVSYNPLDIKKILRYSGNTKKELQFIIAKWNLSEPSASEKFRDLDYRLLREALHKFYQDKYPTTTAGRPTMRKFISDIFVRIGAPSNATLETFLSSSAKHNNIVLTEILKPAINSGQIINPFSIIARSFMLLRISSASVQDLLNYAGYDKSLLEFWWKDILKKKAIWDISTPPASMTELWDDVAISINNLSSTLAPGAAAINPLILKQSNAEDTITLKQFQRAHLWAIGI